MHERGLHVLRQHHAEPDEVDAQLVGHRCQQRDDDEGQLERSRGRRRAEEDHDVPTIEAPPGNRSADARPRSGRRPAEKVEAEHRRSEQDEGTKEEVSSSLPWPASSAPTDRRRRGSNDQCADRHKRHGRRPRCRGWCRARGRSSASGESAQITRSAMRGNALAEQLFNRAAGRRRRRPTHIETTISSSVGASGRVCAKNSCRADRQRDGMPSERQHYRHPGVRCLKAAVVGAEDRKRTTTSRRTARASRAEGAGVRSPTLGNDDQHQRRRDDLRQRPEGSMTPHGNRRS